jgi:hypothetical protein
VSKERQAVLRMEAEEAWARDGYIVIGDAERGGDEVDGGGAGMRCVIL